MGVDPSRDVAEGGQGSGRWVFWGGIGFIAWGAFGDTEWLDSDGALRSGRVFGRTLLFLWLTFLFSVGWKIWRRYASARQVWRDSDDESYEAANRRHAKPVGPDLPEGMIGAPDLRGAGLSRDGAMQIETIEGEEGFDFERYLPRFVGAAFALFVLLHFSKGLTRMPDIVPSLFAMAMVYAMGAGMFMGLRFLVRSTRRVRTFSSQSPRFKLGALAGLVLFLASGGYEPSGTTAVWDLSDGFGKPELGLVSVALLRLISVMGIAGLFFDFVGKRFGVLVDAGESGER